MAEIRRGVGPWSDLLDTICSHYVYWFLFAVEIENDLPCGKALDLGSSTELFFTKVGGKTVQSKSLADKRYTWNSAT